MKTEACKLIDHGDNSGLPCVKDNFVILYHNGEYEVFIGTLEQAIKYVKYDDNYQNYGHLAATIIGYRKMYTIKDEVVEKTFV